MARAEDLDLVENLIVNKEGRIPDIDRHVGRDPVSTATTLIVHDQEFHTSVWGHVGLLGLRDHVLLPGYAGYQGTAAASLVPTNAEVADLARAQGGIMGYVHPFDSDPDPADTTRALTAEFPVDLALGKIDYYEALGFVDDPMATAHVWYRALNCGFRLPAGAGTDAMTNFASLRGPVGMNRVYVHTGPGLEQRRLLDSLRAGRSFATNGPLLALSVEGHGLGEELRLARPGTVRARVRLRSNVPIDHLELVLNGDAREIPLGGEHRTADTTVSPDGGAERVDPPPGAERPGHRAGARPLPVRHHQPGVPDRCRSAGPLDGRRRLFPALDRPAGGGGEGQPGLEYRRRARRDTGPDPARPRGVRTPALLASGSRYLTTSHSSRRTRDRAIRTA